MSEVLKKYWRKRGIRTRRMKSWRATISTEMGDEARRVLGSGKSFLQIGLHLLIREFLPASNAGPRHFATRPENIYSIILKIV